MLGLVGVADFPYQLSTLKTKTVLPIPAVDFTKAAPSLKRIFNIPINIYVVPDAFFVTKFREIFQKGKTLVRQTADELLATTTQLCSFLRDARLWEIFDSSLTLTPQIRAFY